MYIYDVYIHTEYILQVVTYITSDFEIHDIFLGFSKQNHTYFFKATTSEKTRQFTDFSLYNVIFKKSSTFFCAPILYKPPR